MHNIAGVPVEGADFHAREPDIKRLSGTLENNDVLLLGPRRIGKTSIARAIMELVRSQGWRAVEINVAACQDEREFLSKLEDKLRPQLASLSDKAKTAIGDGLTAISTRIKKVKVSITSVAALEIAVNSPDTEDWTQVADDFLRLMGKVDMRWLVYVDELPIMLFNIIRNDKTNGVQRVRKFLDWFRNDVRALPEARKIRWLVSGSVGLDTLVQQHGMADTINSMKHEGLAAFSEAVAIDMLNKLAASYQIALSTAQAQQLIAAVLWPQPYYLQLAFYQLRTQIANNPRIDVSELIEPAIQSMVQPGEDNDFHHWEERLRIQLPEADAKHCTALLDEAAQDPKGARAESLFAKLQERLPNDSEEDAKQIFVRLRDILQRDAYWWPDDSAGHKRYRFHLEPLRRWWLRRNSL